MITREVFASTKEGLDIEIKAAAEEGWILRGWIVTSLGEYRALLKLDWRHS